ncbi:hypothetical protein C0J50_11103, partial [Silurus asotus]
VQASHCQGDARYDNFSRNTQCTCVALQFLAYQSEGTDFTTQHLDRVLEEGDALYTCTKMQLIHANKFQNDHLNMDEVPERVTTCNQTYNVVKSETMLGCLGFSEFSGESWFKTLPERLKECLAIDVMHALLIVSPECIAIFRNSSGQYGFFDSHSRSAEGLPVPNGKAVLLTFNCLTDMINRIMIVFRDRGDAASYELMPVSFQPEQCTSKESSVVQSNVKAQKPETTGQIGAQMLSKVNKVRRRKEARKNVTKSEKSVPKLNKSQSEKKQYDSCLQFRQNKIQAVNKKYKENADLRNRKIASLKHKYRNDVTFQEKVTEYMRKKYRTDDVFQNKKKLQMVKRYHKQDLYQNTKREYMVGRYNKDISLQNKMKQYMARRYRTNTKFQNKMKQYMVERYRTDTNFQSKMKQYMARRYRTNTKFQNKVKQYMVERYRTDTNFQSKMKQYMVERYRTDTNFQNKMKQYMVERYRTDTNFKDKMKQYMVRRYRTDSEFQSKMKAYMFKRYTEDSDFRAHHILRCTLHKSKTHVNNVLPILHKLNCAFKIKQKYKAFICVSRSAGQLDNVIKPVVNNIMQAAIAAFRVQIQQGPTRVCTVCNRTLFPNQVKSCNRAKYIKNTHVVLLCLTGRYIHACDYSCSVPCLVPEERRQEWICHTCDSYLMRGHMPSIAVANKLALAPIPKELLELNVLERQLISKFLPFVKIVALPKGQQRAVHGAVVCVPSEVEAIANCLPRPNNESQILQVKLKRHLKFKGYQHFHTVNMHNVLAALHKLKDIHSEYKDVSIDEAAQFEIHTEDKKEIQEPEQISADELNEEQHVSTEEQDELRPGLTLDTCLQPPDIAKEMLSYGEGIFSIAPAQGNKPVGFFSVPKLESMAFPMQFPTGENTIDESRTVAISPSMYFNARLFCVDIRFAKDQSYLFFAQFVTETNMARNSMSIQLRKGKPVTRDGRRISIKLLKDKHEVERLVSNRDATRFMQPLRGTPAYWEKTLKDLQAMIRQLGVPTFFCTFSAAEMRWPEVITVIKAQQGELVQFEDLDWTTKCEILRSNPVTVMRMFEKRVDALLRDLLLSDAQPIGEVVDYFYRVEYQARGSPHIHLLAWVKDAPVFEDDPDDTVCKFIDRYITCQMPDPSTDPELHKLVTEVQMHSRNHSKSCKKGNVLCRFGFPKLPMSDTWITRPRPPPPSDKEHKDRTQGKKQGKAKKFEKVKQMMKEAKEKMKPVWDVLNDPKSSFENLPELLKRCNLSMQCYMKYAQALSTGNVVMLKRSPKECWVNGYNRDLLRAWNANMDIQYILDPFCCVLYILSYISKSEHEMNDLLKSVVQDVRKTNVNEKDEMKQIMQAYSKHRQVSAQESVARTCSLPLKKCSRAVVFIQTDDDALKMSLPLSSLNHKNPDSEDVWMSGIVEKYRARPETPHFEKLCLADFASRYRIVYGRQAKGQNVHPLLNNMGYVQQRTVGKPAIIRYARFSKEKHPEKYYGRLLKLYVPHRSDTQLKQPAYPTYELFYHNALIDVRQPRLLVPVCKVVVENQKRYEKHTAQLDQAFELLQEQGMFENAWTAFAPEMEAERLECLMEKIDEEPEQMNEKDDVPEYQLVREDGDGLVPKIEAPQLSVDYVQQLYRSLNQAQASVFYTVRQWCLKRVWGQNPEQFFYFVSGGAGCGKSHVIKCIYAEATKILRQLPRFREQGDMSSPTVLLTAFTGTAAFNISGKTLHSILKLPRRLSPPYQALGNSLDDVRAVLSNTEILIIDEVSMVSKDLFAYVNWRFQQIKGSKKPFGGISVLAVGDFYQLPPLSKSKPLCVYEGGVPDNWKDYFQIVTLTEIMRQKEDLAFAQLLNRIRVKPKHEVLSKEDRALLAPCLTKPIDCPHKTLHIFATNKEVQKHNTAIVNALHPDIVNVEAEDFRKDPRTGEMKKQSKPVKGKKQDLPDVIQVAAGVRVMVMRNLDVEDGLANGSFGTIAKIVSETKDGVMAVKMIGLEMDNPSAGQKHRKRLDGEQDNLVYVERFEERISKGVVRQQFPVKLAYACTAHKVQGMTMQSAVVSLKRFFEPGMAYVALSRTTSLDGLHITDFDEKKIYADPKITASLQGMKTLSFSGVMPLLEHVQLTTHDQSIKIVHHNVQGLPSHIEDVRSHHEMFLADILCITESHLSGSLIPPFLQLNGYTMFTRSRHVSYTTHTEMAKKERGGGVAMYCKEIIQAQARQYIHNVTDLEFLLIKIDAPVTATVVTVYRPPNYNLSHFLPNLQSLLEAIEIMNRWPVIVCGDFNEDLLISTGKKPILELFKSKGYVQVISAATTDNCTLLDHIYISPSNVCAESGVLQTYFSYHNAVYCVL